MIKIFLQYIYLLRRIRRAKIRRYKGTTVSLIYPINQQKLEKKGYSVYGPNSFSCNYIIRWED